MNCYNCRTKIRGNREQCPECGADLTLYRRIIFASNRYYNQGLDRARIRNLSGALDSLEQSIQLYSENVNARNLRGLILYEMGEVAEAVTEWSMSLKISPQDNVASQYLGRITTSVQDLNSDANLIRKWNQVVEYIHTDAKDMAIIQLNKMVGQRPSMIKAYLLLALLYMENKNYDRAAAVLKECRRYDSGNPTAQWYRKELKRLNPRKKKREVIDDEPKNEVIIPVRMWNFGTYLTTALYIFAGMLLAFGVMYYVVVPAVKSEFEKENQDNLNTYQAAKMEDQEEIRQLEEKIKELEGDKDDISNQLSEHTQNSEGTLESYDKLIELLVAYGTRDVKQMVDLLPNVDGTAVQTETYQNAYNIVSSYITDDLFNELYSAATDARNETSREGISEEESLEQWKIAMENYENCLLMQPNNPEVIFYLANCYEATGDIEKAKESYDRIVSEFIDADSYYSEALQRLQEIAGGIAATP